MTLHFEILFLYSGVSCDYPTDTSHATILSRELLFHYQDTVDLVCEDGYHITGEAETVTRKTRTCGHDGTWDDDFTCSGKFILS